MDGSKIEGDVPAEMRREQMLAYVKTQDFVRVTDLSARFHVSEVTVRGDLDVLTEHGLIRRIRGGAMPRTVPRPERPFEEMQGARVNEKDTIGRVAASLISHGETVILDVGTTTTAVARALVRREDLYDVVVFTNALNIALELESAIMRTPFFSAAMELIRAVGSPMSTCLKRKLNAACYRQHAGVLSLQMALRLAK